MPPAAVDERCEFVSPQWIDVAAEFLRREVAARPALANLLFSISGAFAEAPPCRIHALGKSSFRIVLVQGLNRQIRLPCKHFGYDVKTLQRVRIMNVKLRRLKIVQSRNLTDEELKGLLPARQ